MKKPELLAPAGEYEGLLGAVAAGADAVYLGGERFGARAYAPNFTTQELIRGLRFAHLHGRRIYLTLNTLIKEREYPELEAYLQPLDEAGLDGIIVQDQGVLALVRSTFPRIRIHASTQMAVTGAYGAKYLKHRGVMRVVPARELSLEELIHIKKETDDGDGGIEIEAFIHGAMCYSYSGMCLFSAMLGGRSGNRGRCAGACRLPYTIVRDRPGTDAVSSPRSPEEKTGKDRICYPLSLRDMCTLPVLRKLLVPQGLEDGVIDSLKIEGRMKDPVYTAGVTGVYRRAVDAICDRKDRDYRISERDLALLKGLYLRTDLCEGYFFRHNGDEMLTGAAPGYIGSDGAVIEEVKKKMPTREFGVEAEVLLRAVEGEPLQLTLKAAGRHGGEAAPSVTVMGEPVQRASRHAATEETLRTQLNRFGGSDFSPVRMEIEAGEGVFIPSSELNALRRRACEELASLILSQWERKR
ncbi:MAG: U32 family peptidase [Lachnospiraceae bacterium]|nr:U32 family peptidase [Lachnospiraceae bacterium]